MPWADSLAFSQSDRFFKVGGGADERLVVYQDEVVRILFHPFLPVGLDESRVLLELAEYSGNGVRVWFRACGLWRG